MQAKLHSKMRSNLSKMADNLKLRAAEAAQPSSVAVELADPAAEAVQAESTAAVV
jgi:hypothetical protein